MTKISRRSLLAGATTAGITSLVSTEIASASEIRRRPLHRAAPVSGSPFRGVASPQALLIPGAAKGAGFSRLVFQDDFLSSSTFDLKCTGAKGFSWYLAGVHGWGMGDTRPADLSIRDSVLTINPSSNNFNMQLTTADVNTGMGATFGYGYFEARMRFPAKAVSSDFAWPSFWGESMAHFLHGDVAGGWAELDFFEAAAGPRDYTGTLHEWKALHSSSHRFNADHMRGDAADFSQWHTFGCLWKRGSVSWFLDGIHMFSHQLSWSMAPFVTDGNTEGRSEGMLSLLDREVGRGGLNIILGSGVGRPMSVDWVRVWGV